jgi:hypothetical protein
MIRQEEEIINISSSLFGNSTDGSLCRFEGWYLGFDTMYGHGVGSTWITVNAVAPAQMILKC